MFADELDSIAVGLSRVVRFFCFGERDMPLVLIRLVGVPGAAFYLIQVSLPVIPLLEDGRPRFRTFID